MLRRIVVRRVIRGFSWPGQYFFLPNNWISSDKTIKKDKLTFRVQTNLYSFICFTKWWHRWFFFRLCILKFIFKDNLMLKIFKQITIPILILSLILSLRKCSMKIMRQYSGFYCSFLLPLHHNILFWTKAYFTWRFQLM